MSDTRETLEAPQRARPTSWCDLEDMPRPEDCCRCSGRRWCREAEAPPATHQPFRSARGGEIRLVTRPARQSDAVGLDLPHREAADPGDDWSFGHLRRAHYRVILADPPWKFRTYSNKGLKKSAQRHYTCQDLPWIKALPVRHLAHSDGAALVMWATAPLLLQAVATMNAWGFVFKSAGAWAKQSSTGRQWAFGPGLVYRSAAEFWLYGTVGRPRQLVRNVRNLIVAPVRQHSRKPDEMHATLEKMYDGPRAELFARGPLRPGWDLWGDEVGKFDAAEANTARGEV